MRRGWSALLALVLVLVGSGLGAAAPRPASVAAPAHAGAGPADGRDALPVRAPSRPTLLAQRADDPPTATAASEPALAAAVLFPFGADGGAVLLAAGPARPAPTAPPRPYQARAPPAAA